MSTSPSNMQQKLGTAFKSEPKKAIALTVLVLILGVMMVKFLVSGGKPTPARASMTSKTAGSAGSRGKSGPARISPARPGGATAAMLKWSDASVPPISRNLFNVRAEYFPVDGSRTTHSDATDEGFWSSLEKSLALRADQRFKQDTLIANYKAEAGDLKIQSIVMGPQPRAMVNGQMVTEGSVVAGFRVLKIEARRMIIEREGIRLEIQMK